jgi:hypothetical protein
MKNFKKFLEEITIKGNPGIPGEGDKRPGEREYLSDIERRAKDRMELTGRETPMEFGRRMMYLLETSLQETRGKESELEELATNIILSNFDDILYGVELDIKLVRSGQQIANFMKEDEDEEDEDQEMPNFREVTDPELIRRIHKAKLGNVIIQGEAKNTKHILQTSEVKDGINSIFGQQKGEEIFRTWNELSKLADKMDWIIPINIKADMMERSPEGLAGAVKVDWKPKAPKKDNEPKDDDDDDDREDDEIKHDEYTPVIKARGIDFPMLIHEAVKGVFELIASISQPGMDASKKEIEMAQTVKLNVSSFEDEAEDFRTGPEIAKDFRDFINENRKSDKFPNIRAHIFGMMMDPNYMTSEEFLKLFRGILNNTQEARKKIDSMIDEIVEKIKSYELGEILPGQFGDDDSYDSDYGIPHSDSNVDISNLSQRELIELIDKALDMGNKEEVERLSNFLKESKQVYLGELKRINERRGHNRRK